jgi:putative hemolysin
VASAVIGSEPEPYGDRRYSASVQKVTPPQSKCSTSIHSREPSTWKWAAFPRSYTTVDGAIETELNELLGKFLPRPLIEGAPTPKVVMGYEREAHVDSALNTTALLVLCVAFLSVRRDF